MYPGQLYCPFRRALSPPPKILLTRIRFFGSPLPYLLFSLSLALIRPLTSLRLGPYGNAFRPNPEFFISPAPPPFCAISYSSFAARRLAKLRDLFLLLLGKSLNGAVRHLLLLPGRFVGAASLADPDRFGSLFVGLPVVVSPSGPRPSPAF